MINLSLVFGSIAKAEGLLTGNVTVEGAPTVCGLKLGVYPPLVTVENDAL